MVDACVRMLRVYTLVFLFQIIPQVKEFFLVRPLTSHGLF